MSTIKLAIIGAGHLGRIHAKLAQQLDDVDIVGVSDPNADARQTVVDQFSLPVASSYERWLDQLDAAIVAAPTVLHQKIVADLLAHQVHVLVEKPITLQAAAATALVEQAERQQCVLQVGHVERFNPALESLQASAPRVFYLSATRATGFTFRSTDVGVVMDLMIHDIDLALSMIRSPVVDVRAVGASVFGEHEDIAQARLQFANGSVANLTASRASYAPQRTLQLFTAQGFAELDLTAGQATRVTPHADLASGQLDVRQLSGDEQVAFREQLFEKWLVKEEVQVEPINAILEEQRDFIQAIRTGVAPRVTGADGRDAVAVAERVLKSLGEHRWEPKSSATPRREFETRKAS